MRGLVGLVAFSLTGSTDSAGQLWLRHPARAQILETVQREPGLSYGDLLRCTGLANGTLSHHLAVLGRMDRIVRLREGRFSCFFDAGMPPEHRRAWAVVRRPGVQAALGRIGSSGDCGAAELAAAFSVHASTMARRLRHWESVGLVRLRRNGLVTGAELTPLARDILRGLAEGKRKEKEREGGGQA